MASLSNSSFPPCLANPKLETTSAFKHMPGGLGSSGAFRITTDVGELVVKEGPRTVDVELFGSLLCTHLSNVLLPTDQADDGDQHTAGFMAPRMRLLKRGCALSRSLVRQMSLLSVDDEEEVQRGHQLSKPEYLILMEFITGLGLCEITSLRPEVLQALGKALVFDLLINNWDRIPTPPVWTNQGNPANLLFVDTHVVLIDQTVTPIKHKANRQKYLDMVSCLCRDAMLAGEEKRNGRKNSVEEWIGPRSGYDISKFLKKDKEATMAEALAGVQSWINEQNSSVSVDEKGIFALQEGFKQALQTLTSVFGEATFDIALDHVAKLVMTMTEDVGDVIDTAAADQQPQEQKEEAVAVDPLYCSACERKFKDNGKFDKHLTGSLHKMRIKDQEEQQAMANAPVELPEDLKDAVAFVKDVFNVMLTAATTE